MWYRVALSVAFNLDNRAAAERQAKKLEKTFIDLLPSLPPKAEVTVEDDPHQQSAVEWKKIKDHPIPNDLSTKNGFWVGSSTGGRMDYVFLWPGGNGKLTYWIQGDNGRNRQLTGYKPDVWYPGPPAIPGSWVDRLQRGEV
jgi:hypothetical protein